MLEKALKISKNKDKETAVLSHNIRNQTRGRTKRDDLLCQA